MYQEQHQRPGVNCQGSRFLPSAKRAFGALALLAAMALLTSCGSGNSGGSGTGTVPPPSALKITTSTTFSPTFDPTISDYVATAPSGPLQVSVNAPPGTQVSVDGQTARANAFTASVAVTAGQSFSMVVTSAGTSNTYFVRCLPTDFPNWTTERPGTPQTEYYAFTPGDSLTNNGSTRKYLIIADNHGVPIWWYRSSDTPSNATLVANGNIAWTNTTGVEEHKLNGTVVRTFTADSADAGKFDFHELQQLPNGDYIIMADVIRGPVNLSPFGGPAVGTVFDNEIEEISPSGTLVWRWSAMDHIPVAEIDQVWWAEEIQPSSIGDPYHMNSVEPDGTGFVVSLRHLDAVIRIDKATGNIVWKLGGTHRAESLTFSGDTYGNFGGQHDARILADGTLTVHDNGTMKGRAPRAARFRIDTVAKTATFVEQVTDPAAPASVCCGSARKGPGGDWVITWGDNPVVNEFTPAGVRVFRMTNKEPYFSYRALPVLPGVLNRAALRAGMDAQFPR